MPIAIAAVDVLPAAQLTLQSHLITTKEVH